MFFISPLILPFSSMPSLDSEPSVSKRSLRGGLGGLRLTRPIAIVCANGCRVTEGPELFEGVEGDELYNFSTMPSMPSFDSGPSVSNVLCPLC